jgi:phosphate transport system substrate-binding protein
MKNAAGNYLKGSIETVTAAAATAKIPADYRVSITNAPGPNAYPLSSFTYLLIPTQPKDAAKEKVIKDMLSWAIRSGEGEVSSLSFAPLPDALAAQVLKTIYALP